MALNKTINVTILNWAVPRFAGRTNIDLLSLILLKNILVKNRRCDADRRRLLVFAATFLTSECEAHRTRQNENEIAAQKLISLPETISSFQYPSEEYRTIELPSRRADQTWPIESTVNPSGKPSSSAIF